MNRVHGLIVALVMLADAEGAGPFGERVSELELRYLSRLADTLGVDPG